MLRCSGLGSIDLTYAHILRHLLDVCTLKFGDGSLVFFVYFNVFYIFIVNSLIDYV